MQSQKVKTETNAKGESMVAGRCTGRAFEIIIASTVNG